ncbi:hypothetical protein [Pleionea sediminis]|uniref:hypothetical protein n=1 Tax=Pleionea sediminis TaxID=2569479 RepID=UPI001185366F|nr:hypothetical protein [Pleionea sediminis]
MTNDIEISTFGLLDKNNQFELDEAVKLMHCHVAKKCNSKRNKKKLRTEEIGIVVGLLVINEEVEIVLKFLQGMKQVTKAEFNDSFILLDD